MNSTGLPFKVYDDFKRAAINERADLYRAVLEYEFGEYKNDDSYKIKIVGIDPSKDSSMHEVYGLDPAKAQ